MKQTERRRKLGDPKEKERLLMQYAGIFKHNIAEYAERLGKFRFKKKINYSK